MRAQTATLIGIFTAEQHRLAGSHYNPNQPRAPQGTTIGGRWIASGQPAAPAARPGDDQLAFDFSAAPEPEAAAYDTMSEPGMREAEAVRLKLLDAAAKIETRYKNIDAEVDAKFERAQELAKVFMYRPPDDPEGQRLEAEWNQLTGEAMQMAIAADAKRAKQREALLRIVQADSPAQMRIGLKEPEWADKNGIYAENARATKAVWDALPKEQQAQLLAGLKTANRLMDANGTYGLDGNIRLNMAPAGETRASCSYGVITITPNTGATTMVHELGHHIEQTSFNDLHKRTRDFLARRTAGETPRPLKEIQPDLDYRPDEISRPDKFISPYTGKVYPHDTEVISMGLEQMANDPVGFAKADPDHWRFTYTIMRGTWRERNGT